MVGCIDGHEGGRKEFGCEEVEECGRGGEGGYGWDYSNVEEELGGFEGSERLERAFCHKVFYHIP